MTRIWWKYGLVCGLHRKKVIHSEKPTNVMMSGIVVQLCTENHKALIFMGVKNWSDVIDSYLRKMAGMPILLISEENARSITLLVKLRNWVPVLTNIFSSVLQFECLLTLLSREYWSCEVNSLYDEFLNAKKSVKVHRLTQQGFLNKFRGSWTQ